jgi:hypothetical protein
MPLNGSGLYVLPVGFYPAVATGSADPSLFNTLAEDITAAISTMVAKDGQTQPTQNLPMNSKKHTNAASATASGDYLVFGQTNASLSSLSVSGALSASGSISVGNAKSFLVFDTLTGGASSALKAQTTFDSDVLYMTRGWATVSDGGHGIYRWNSASTATGNDGTIVVPTSNPANGRWELVYSGEINARQFGAKGNGTADDTAKIVAAIAALPAQGGTVYLPTGTYKTTSTITISNHRVHLRGDGNWATRILFAPTANSTCLQIGSLSQVTYQGSVVGITFWSDDSTFTKTAIDFLDASTYLLDDIVIGGSIPFGSSSFWSGGSNNSIGLKVRGREAGRISRVYIYADRPIVIGGNPSSSIDIDHFYFENCNLVAHVNPVVEIETGVNLTQVTFSGYQAWVIGTHGLYWLDTTSSQTSNGLSLNNVRFENGSDVNAYAVRIEHNTNLQNLSLTNCFGDPLRKGIYLRKVVDVDIESYYHPAANEALNVDSTVARLTIQGSFWQAGCTASITGQQLAWRSSVFSNAQVAGNAVYDVPSNSKGIVIGDAISEEILTVADATAVSIGATLWGCFVVTTNQGHIGIFQMHGSNNAVTEAIDPSTVFSTTAGTASSTNVYWSGANSRYELENRRGGPMNYKITHLGSKVNF